MKNAISRVPQGFEQSHLDARFAAPECTLLALQYRWRNSSSISFFYIYLNFLKKKMKNHLKNHKDLSSHTWTPDLQPLSVL